jgi:hypothetical protein
VFRRLLVTCTLLALALPAPVFACGAYIPLEGEASLDRERALVIWDGAIEQALIELAVTSDAAEAAWIIPTPAPAEVELGDAAVLDLLDDLTRPKIVVEHRPGWPALMAGAGAPEAAGGVDLLSRQTLGPFDVATLAATDAGALQGWLAENGYVLPDTLGPVLEPYVERGWTYVAVRLTPEAQGDTLTGQLDPLWLTFPAAEPAFAMRAAATAYAEFPLTLYVLAEHRVTKNADFGRSEVAYADWLDPAGLSSSSDLAARMPGRLFLTKFRDRSTPPW